MAILGFTVSPGGSTGYMYACLICSAKGKMYKSLNAQDAYMADIGVIAMVLFGFTQVFGLGGGSWHYSPLAIFSQISQFYAYCSFTG
ncbi:MAG: hypothetical protein WA888_13215 [Burkholderiaceae bacterium]